MVHPREHTLLSCSYTFNSCMCMHTQLLNYFQHFVTPWTVCSLPGSSVHEISQGRILEWLLFPSSTVVCMFGLKMFSELGFFCLWRICLLLIKLGFKTWELYIYARNFWWNTVPMALPPYQSIWVPPKTATFSQSHLAEPLSGVPSTILTLSPFDFAILCNCLCPQTLCSRRCILVGIYSFSHNTVATHSQIN